MILPFAKHLKRFLDLDWASGYPQNLGRRPCKFSSQQLKQSLSPRLSYVRSHVSVCDSHALASQDLLITSEFMGLEAYGLDI